MKRPPARALTTTSTGYPLIVIEHGENVAVLMVLLDGEGTDRDPALSQLELAKLTRLGITSVSLLHDDRMIGLVLDVWPFDPARWAEAARAAGAGDENGARTLRPLVQMAVSAAPAKGGLR
jgi:hypothetical protein